MATKQVNLPNIGPVMLYKRRGNRSLRLSIASDGEVRVSMPYWLPYKACETFAIAKSRWIAEHHGLAARPGRGQSPQTGVCAFGPSHAGYHAAQGQPD